LPWRFAPLAQQTPKANISFPLFFCSALDYIKPTVIQAVLPTGGHAALSGCFCFFERSVVSVQVIVRDNNVDQALKALKKKMQREGIFREMKLRRHFEKPSEKKAREGAEAVRRSRKLERKRIEREGF
jgi:small subunit ribosomal protein S21|tara:strand:- start:217 stop:600 length:384 start_codon:yes stop_codon:yes gene_type:complete